jgi:hypothetical protein
MPKRGISMHWTLARDVEELAGNAEVAWNRMAVTLIELGMDVFKQLQLRAPGLAREIVKIRSAPLEGRRRRTLDRIVEGSANMKRLDAHLGLAVPWHVKSKLLRNKARTGISMSAQARRKLEAD